MGDELAAAGYWALRFDYPGTGDSLDTEVARAGGHWNAFAGSIDRACTWLREKSGARKIVLVGLRAGAMLAALTAARRDVPAAADRDIAADASSTAGAAIRKSRRFMQPRQRAPHPAARQAPRPTSPDIASLLKRELAAPRGKTRRPTPGWSQNN